MIIHSKLEIVISLFVSVILLFPWQNPPSFSTSLKLTILKLRLAQKKIHIDTKNNLIRHGHQMSPVAHSSSNVVNYIQRQRVGTWGRSPKKQKCTPIFRMITDQVLFLCFVMLSESEKFSLNRQKLFTESAILFWRFSKI